jgi:hypothetical protein
MPDDSLHVFWLRPLPGVRDVERVIVAVDNTDQTSIVVVLPDNTQVTITADKAVCFRGNHMLTLSQWQYAPVTDEYCQEETEAPELPEATPPEIPQRRYGQTRPWPVQPPPHTRAWREDDLAEDRAPWPHSASTAPPR